MQIFCLWVCVFFLLFVKKIHCIKEITLSAAPIGLVVKPTAFSAGDPGFESRLTRFFLIFLKICHLSILTDINHISASYVLCAMFSFPLFNFLGHFLAKLEKIIGIVRIWLFSKWPKTQLAPTPSTWGVGIFWKLALELNCELLPRSLFR